MFKLYARVIVFLIIVSGSFQLKLFAQTPLYFKGTGTGTNTIPMNTAGSHTQQIYLPSDFNTAPISGNITKIYFRNSVAGASGVYTNFSVSFLQNSLTAFPNTTFLTGFTIALSQASITINGNATAAGWYEIPLSTPFLYDNSQTLIVEIKYDSRTGGISGPTSTATGNKRLSIITAPGAATGNLSTLWGDFGMEVLSASACTNPPVAGSAVSSVTAPVCTGTPVTLGLSGNSIGSGQTYKWQSSALANGTYTDISAASVSTSFTVNPAATLFYRAAVVCSGTPVYSTPVQVTVNPLFRSGNYSINASQATGGTNFQTFTDAVNAIKCGIDGPVVFNVTPAVYNEQVTIPAIGNTSATNTVRFKGNLATISFNSTTTGSRAGITLDGADFVTIDSLLITATGSSTTEYGWGVQLTNGADNNRVSNCTINVSTTNISAYNFLGVVLGGSATTPFTSTNAGSNNIITGNTIVGGYYPVIAYGNSAAPYPAGNVISNNTIQEAYSYTIYLYGNVNTVVSKNNISRPARATSTTTGGVYLSTGCTGVLVEKNRIHNMFDGLTTNTSTMYGVFVAANGTAAAPNKIVNNTLYDINHNGPVYGIYNSGSAYMQAYHNTISLDNTAATAGATYGMYQITTAAGIEYRNNIVTITRGGSGVKYTMYFSTAGSTHTSNNNVLYINSGGSGAQSIGYYGGTIYPLLSDWQLANARIYDQQSVSLDPVYTNAGSGNFTPGTSLVNNIGAAVGVVTDIRDSARSTTNPDAGAYEFSTLTAGLNMGAEALVSPGVNSNGCYTSAETVTIRIRNNSTSAINFATNPVTVTTTLTGAATQTLTATVNTGTLASDATRDVVMGQALNMTATGTYTFSAATNTTGDINTSNDAMLPVTRTKVALTSGNVTVSPSTFCAPTPLNPKLSATGFAGTSGVQWLQSISATTGFTPVSGATTIPYTVSAALSRPMYYKLVATCGLANDTSAVVTVGYSNPQVTGTTPATICGAGSVTLQATGTAGTTLNWYAGATGGLPLAAGNSFTTNISASTTYYVEANEGGISTGAAPILITELELGTNDRLEIQNISGSPIDITGWKVAVSNSYTDITSVNANIQVLSGVMAPGDINTWTDATAGPNYWGSNILYNPGAFPTFTGWAAIIDNNNNLVDIVFMNWPAANIQAASLIISTAVVSPGTKWSGDGVNITAVAETQSVSRQGNTDNNSLNDFSILNLSVGTTNPGLNLPFSGFGCASARTPVLAKIDCTTPVTLLNFKGERQGPINKLEWTTVTENNNRGFELQRSADGSNFTGLLFTTSKAVNGNSTNAITYTANDAKPLAGNSYYRLKQIDNDGKFTYTRVVLIKGLKVTALMVSSIYPNPVKDQFNMIITSPAAEKISVLITDVSGRIVHRQNEIITVGDNVISFPVSTWAKGSYFIKAAGTNGGETAVQKFIKE